MREAYTSVARCAFDYCAAGGELPEPSVPVLTDVYYDEDDEPYVLDAYDDVHNQAIHVLRMRPGADSLKARLTTYMIPSLLIPMARMPRTGTGKLDRTVLAQQGVKVDVERDLSGVDQIMNDHGLVTRAASVTIDGKIVSFVVVREACRSTNAELLRYCGFKLVRDAAPVAIVRVESVPLTSDGEVDRDALAGREETQEALRMAEGAWDAMFSRWLVPAPS